MGEGRTYKCPKCGYELDVRYGSGFMFPTVYKETVAKMKKGELGAEAQQFFEEHPDGAISVDDILAQCKECGQYETVRELTMYVPKPGHVHSAPAEGVDYVLDYELEENYKVFQKYPHRCRSCGGKMKLISERTLKGKELVCPCCGEAMEITDMLLWD